MASTKPIPINLKPDRYHMVLGFIGLLHVIVLGLLFFGTLGGIHVPSAKAISAVAPHGYYYLISVWWIALAALLYYDYDAIKRVRPGWVAGIIALGRPAIETAEGFKYVPRWLTELHQFPRSIQEDQFPSDPENIVRKPEDRALHPSMFDPMRMTTGGPEPSDDDSDMLDVRQAIEPELAVFWQVQDIGFFEFYINIPGNDWAEKRSFILKMMRDTGQSELANQVKDDTLSKLLKKQDVIQERVQEKLAEEVNDWGISICSAKIQNLNGTHKTNDAMSLIPEARAQRTAEIHIAEGQKQAEILRAEGRRQARITEAEGEKQATVLVSEGQKEAAENLDMDGADWIAASVARDVVGSATTILGTEPVVASIKKLFQKEGA